MYSWFMHLIQIDITKIRNQCTKCWHIIDTDWSNLLCYIMIVLSNLTFIFRDPKKSRNNPLYFFPILPSSLVSHCFVSQIINDNLSSLNIGRSTRGSKKTAIKFKMFNSSLIPRKRRKDKVEVERKRNVKQRKRYRAKIIINVIN